MHTFWHKHTYTPTPYTTPPTHPPTHEREVFDVFGDGLPAGEVSIALQHAPEEEPVKVADVVHDEQRPLFELFRVAKRVDTNPEKVL